MFTARMCEAGLDVGKWYAVVIESSGERRVGYCAATCGGHASAEDALSHHLQYQLDREAQLWLDRRSPPTGCEICGDATTLRARLGRDTKLFVLCTRHQSTSSLSILFRQRHADQQPGS
jgi:hypothetical protein